MSLTETTSGKPNSLSFDIEAMQQFATVTLLHGPSSETPGKEPEMLTVPSFYTHEFDEAKGYEKRTGGHLYSWCCVGPINWLVAGVSISDLFCLLVLPEYRGSYVDLADDEEDDYENEQTI